MREDSADALGLTTADRLSLAVRDEESGIKPCSCMDPSQLHGIVDVIISLDIIPDHCLAQYVAAAELATEPDQRRCDLRISADTPAGRLLARARERVSRDDIDHAKAILRRENAAERAHDERNPHRGLARLWQAGWEAAQLDSDPHSLLIDPDQARDDQARDDQARDDQARDDQARDDQARAWIEARNDGVRAGIAWRAEHEGENAAGA